MINDILDITGVGSNRLELSPEPVRITPLIKDILVMMSPMATGSDIHLNFDETQDGAGLHVRADRRRLEQVLTSLLSNAIKYNTAGGRVEVRLTTVGDDRLRIAIIDNGMGIPAEAQPRLFNPFDRLGRQDFDIDGTGIGLVLARRLMTLMGGRIDVETVDGSGTAFTITLPTIAAPEAIEPPSPLSPAASTSVRNRPWSTARTSRR